MSRPSLPPLPTRREPYGGPPPAVGGDAFELWPRRPPAMATAARPPSLTGPLPGPLPPRAPVSRTQPSPSPPQQQQQQHQQQQPRQQQRKLVGSTDSPPASAPPRQPQRLRPRPAASSPPPAAPERPGKSRSGPGPGPPPTLPGVGPLCRPRLGTADSLPRATTPLAGNLSSSRAGEKANLPAGLLLGEDGQLDNRTEKEGAPSAAQGEESSRRGEQVAIKKSKHIELTADESIVEQMAAANDKDNNGRSITSSAVSSLSDTVSYQRTDGGRRSRRGRKERSGGREGSMKSPAREGKPTSSVSVMATLMFRPLRRRRTPAQETAPPFAPPLDLHDTVTTATTGETAGRTNNAKLETIDKALEQQLFRGTQGDPRRQLGVGPSLSLSRSMTSKGAGVNMPSPLGLEIDRETHSLGSRGRDTGGEGPWPLVMRRARSTNNRAKLGWTSARNVRQERTLRDERWASSRLVHEVSPLTVNVRGNALRSGAVDAQGPALWDEIESSQGLAENGEHRCSSSFTSSGSDFGNSSENVGIQAPLSIHSLSKVQQLNQMTKHESQAALLKSPKPGEDLIDITNNEPIDPFSGLIGMPSSIGCERSIISGDGDSYAGLNVFGSSSAVPPSLPYIKTPGSNNLDGSTDDGATTSFRPPRGHRRVKTTSFDEFDPLMEEEMPDSNARLMSGYRSPSSASLGIPPRYYKDDPLLRKSRYRSPLQQSPKKSGRKDPTARHRRSLSAGSRSDMNLGTCMIGSIATLEATKTPTTPLGDVSNDLHCASGEWDGSPSTGDGQTLTSELTSGVVMGGNRAFLTPNHQGAGSAAGDQEEEDDDGSSRSFSEEYHRAEQKHKIVAKEMKHIIGKVLPVGKPVAKVGRKLLGREKEETGMKRSEGCLT